MHITPGTPVSAPSAPAQSELSAIDELAIAQAIIASLSQQVANRDAQIADLDVQIASRDAHIDELYGMVHKSHKTLATMIEINKEITDAHTLVRYGALETFDRVAIIDGQLLVQAHDRIATVEAGKITSVLDRPFEQRTYYKHGNDFIISNGDVELRISPIEGGDAGRFRIAEINGEAYGANCVRIL